MGNTTSQRRPSALNSLKIKVASAVGARDWSRVIESYSKYGAYLELTGDDEPCKEKLILTWPKQEQS